VLAHNPDSAIALPSRQVALVLTGHTHGGQIRLPRVYKRVIPSQYGFDRGEQLLQTPQGPVRVFTTVGTGEIGLPLRLFNPPTIDVLELRP
jgi:predicted MPP superfamily phosphohydrolase